MPHANSALRNSQRDRALPHPLAGLATRRTVRRQRRVWTRRASSWDQHGSAGLAAVTAAVITAAAPQPGSKVVDLGCGQGQVSLPLARLGAQVLGVDVSPAMVAQLNEAGRRESVPGLAAVAIPIEELAMPPASADLIVSSYALHHLRDADKAALVRDAFFWLRPGGRLVIADMMLGRGRSSRDRAIIRQKLAVLARKGPGGWWRIAKSVARYLLRIQECPVSMNAWTRLLEQAGFSELTAEPIVAEAGLVTGVRPASPPERAGDNAGDQLR